MAYESARPDVSVIVVNYRSAELTVRALECTERSAAEVTLEEIIVDAGSSERDLALLRDQRPQARILELGDNRGFAAGNNAGISHSRGRYLLLLNPDAFAEGNALAALVRHLEVHHDTGLVGPLLYHRDGSLQDSAHRRFPNLFTLFIEFCTPLGFLLRGRQLDPYHVPRARLTVPREIAHVTGAVMLVRREAADAAGPLDEGFFLYLEEMEWQSRMARVGWRREVLPSARFMHLGGASSEGFALASVHYLDSVRRYYRHPRLALAVVMLAAVVSRVTLRVVIGLGFGSQRLRELERGFGKLIALLRESPAVQ